MNSQDGLFGPANSLASAGKQPRAYRRANIALSFTSNRYRLRKQRRFTILPDLPSFLLGNTAGYSDISAHAGGEGRKEGGRAGDREPETAENPYAADRCRLKSVVT